MVIYYDYIYYMKKLSLVSLVRFNGTVNTKRSFWCQGFVQTDVLSGKQDKLCCPHKLVNTNYRGTLEKKKHCQSDKHTKEIAEKDNISNKEKSCSSPMLFQHSMSITQQLIPIYNTTVHKNKNNVSPSATFSLSYLNLLNSVARINTMKNKTNGRTYH